MSQERTPDIYYFNKFVRELMDQEAEIKIYGRTYKESNKHLSIRNLVATICEFDKKTKLGDVTRKTMELKDEIAKNGRRSELQKNVIHEIGFYFDVKGFPEKKKSVLIQKDPDYYFPMIIANKNDFYVPEEFGFRTVYPKISKKIYRSIINELKQKLIKSEFFIEENLVSPDGEGLDLYERLKLYSPTKNPFSELFWKLTEDSFDMKSLNGRMDYFITEYKRVKNKENKINGDDNLRTKIIPEYGNGIDIDLDEYKSSSEYKEQNNLKDYFADEEVWFDKYRHERLLLIKSKLLNMHIKEWPKGAIEHVLFTQVEFDCIERTLIEIGIKEIKENLKYYLYSSPDGATLHLQKNISSLPDLATILSNYRYPGGIKKHLNVERGTMLEGKYHKNPNKLNAKNNHSVDVIFIEILTSISDHFAATLSKSMGLNDRFKENISGEIFDNIFMSENDKLKHHG